MVATIGALFSMKMNDDSLPAALAGCAKLPFCYHSRLYLTLCLRFYAVGIEE